MEGDYFRPPPECPVFRPSVEEFQQPLVYIASIRSAAERTGICKIVPPQGWAPPFAVDVDNFKFTPRIQRLNELEAHSRIKLNFLDKVAKFWDLQGSVLKVPIVERKALDLYRLYKCVEDEGGFELCCKERKWSKIAGKMGYPNFRQAASTLRCHYERILHPLQMVESGASLEAIRESRKKAEEASCTDGSQKEYVPHSIPYRQSIKPPAERYSRRSKRHGKEDCPEGQLDVKPPYLMEEDSIDYTSNKELKKLQFYGAGPKMPGYVAKAGEEASTPSPEPEEEFLPLGKKGKLKAAPIPMEINDPDYGAYEAPNDQVDQIMCQVCQLGDQEDRILLCDGCDDSYHTYCLTPPLSDVPKGDWRCPKCVAAECQKPHEAFGFEQATKEYTLQSFSDMADTFKRNYFGMMPHLVPFEVVEKEFWRLVSSIDEDVTVEYGADLHTMNHGSGFPTKQSAHVLPGDEQYITSGWNLNVLPALEGSVLGHINADISGMKIPWMYVGMCFATFCWHNEDHWSYSINYLHWGEPKTWYGVPGGQAEKFEEAMSNAAPELFMQQPDLLHQLVTILNPNILMEMGVPVFRTNQHAGEFVVTFPRAYHAGFNQGFNFAEAVNFCPSDWLLLGRKCIAEYSRLRRYCVFSHDEVVCKMAAEPGRLDIGLAMCVAEDMEQMIATETDLRRRAEKEIKDFKRQVLELIQDDERQCDECKTTCFLSAVTCQCERRVVCVRHLDNLCSCHRSKYTLRYRYTLDELNTMLQRVKNRAYKCDHWRYKAKLALGPASNETRQSLESFKLLIGEANDEKLPETDLIAEITQQVQAAEKLSAVAQQILCHKVRTRHRFLLDSKPSGARFDVDELEDFLTDMRNLKCELREQKLVEDMLTSIHRLKGDIIATIATKKPDPKSVEELLDRCSCYDVDLLEVKALTEKLEQAKWLYRVDRTLGEPDEVNIDILRKLIDDGTNLPNDAAVQEAMATLQELLVKVEALAETARLCLQARPPHTIAELESVIAQADLVPAYIDNIEDVRDAVESAKEWTAKAEMYLEPSDSPPLVDQIENLIAKSSSIPVSLDTLQHLILVTNNVMEWREYTARTFIRKGSPLTLTEALLPRFDLSNNGAKSKKKKNRDGKDDKEKDGGILGHLDLKLEELIEDKAAMLRSYRAAQQREIEGAKALRVYNQAKRTEDTGDMKYCICRREMFGVMLQCELCKDWFHSTCVPLSKSAMKTKLGPLGNSAGKWSQLSKEMKFLCPVCHRSRRPRLETILSLLVQLQKLNVRIPEGEALQCLTERAMNWQDRARNYLAMDEISGAYSQLSSSLSQKLTEFHAKDKQARSIIEEAPAQSASPEITGSELSNSEHAYSTVSKSGASSGAVQSPRKHARKSPLVPRQLDPSPTLQITERMKGQLEELMMEGDLLEVTLDETVYLWRLLQATVANPEGDDQLDLEYVNFFQDLENEVIVEQTMDRKRQLKKQKLRMASKELAAEEPPPTHDELLDSAKRRKFEKDGQPSKILKNKDGNIRDGSSGGKKKKKNRHGKRERPGLKVTKPKKSTLQPVRLLSEDSDDDDDDDYDDPCAAATCLRPVGKVNWVQCDGGCDLWFHFDCIGITAQDLIETEDYICGSCQLALPPTISQSKTSSEPSKKPTITADISERTASVQPNDFITDNVIS